MIRLGFEREIPDHSTFSKNRHGRFRGVGIFLEVFEEIVRRCLEAGLVEGKRLTVDGTLVTANASPQRGAKPEQLHEVARFSRTVREYLADLARENPVSENEEKPAPKSVAARYVSTTNPDACWASKYGGPGVPSYFDHYLIDNASCIILGVEATQARFRQETLAARRMLVPGPFISRIHASDFREHGPIASAPAARLRRDDLVPNHAAEGQGHAVSAAVCKISRRSFDPTPSSVEPATSSKVPRRIFSKYGGKNNGCCKAPFIMSLTISRFTPGDRPALLRPRSVSENFLSVPLNLLETEGTGVHSFS